MLQPESPAQLEAVPRPQYRWYHKTAGLIAVILLFEIGIFLLVWPWASDWDLAFLPYAFARSGTATTSGALSAGSDVLNIYLFFIEVFRLRRFSSHT